jgi:hypothetical protein
VIPGLAGPRLVVPAAGVDQDRAAARADDEAVERQRQPAGAGLHQRGLEPGAMALDRRGRRGQIKLRQRQQRLLEFEHAIDANAAEHPGLHAYLLGAVRPDHH